MVIFGSINYDEFKIINLSLYDRLNVSFCNYNILNYMFTYKISDKVTVFVLYSRLDITFLSRILLITCLSMKDEKYLFSVKL